MSYHEDRLEGLRQDFAEDETFPNALAAWEAIRYISRENRNRAAAGEAAIPIPDWLNEYLLRCADKIGRLWLGIRPDDNRTISEIGPDNVGELRKVQRGERVRDERAGDVAAALGFVIKGTTVFQKVDQISKDEAFLDSYDNPDLLDNKALVKEIQELTLNTMMRQDSITEGSAKNRLSKARERRRRRLIHRT